MWVPVLLILAALLLAAYYYRRTIKTWPAMVREWSKPTKSD